MTPKPDAVATLAFDRASARVFDEDGHLHVKRTPISKANVCEYLGREIPGHEELGLDPERRYRLLRDPEELAKAAASFNNKPLLFGHNPISADEHDHDRTVGVVSNPVFENPYLYADLACWTGPAIRAVQSGSHKELSSAYRYRADMIPGSYEGARYDGVMRDLLSNHVALVEKGRAGPDVVVGDAALKEVFIMAKSALSGAAAQTQGALAVYLRPKLAQDATVDFGPIVEGLTTRNYKARIPAVVLGLQKAVRGKLAQDADIADVAEVVEALEAILPPDVAASLEEAVEEGASDDADVELRALLKAKGLSDEEIDRICAAGAPAAVDEDADKKTDSDKKPPAMDGFMRADTFEAYKRDQAKRDRASKIAQDKALADQEAALTAKFSAISDARRTVRPWVGELPMSFDSAEGVLRHTLGMLGKSVAGKHGDALMDILETCPKPGDASKKDAVAMDAVGAKSFDERFGAARIGFAA